LSLALIKKALAQDAQSLRRSRRAKPIYGGSEIVHSVKNLAPPLGQLSFRFIGLAFLVPGVVSPDLPSAFARSAAYGDVIAATLASLSLLWLPRGTGVVLAWIFNLWGSADLLNAFYQANHAPSVKHLDPSTSQLYLYKL
jgi:hypothetical protein